MHRQTKAQERKPTASFRKDFQVFFFKALFFLFFIVVNERRNVHLQ